MKTAALQKALPSVVGIIADRSGVEVKTGSNACTDGKVIYLPPLPMQLDEEDFVRTIGYVYHECGHVLDTDFSTPFTGPLQRSIANPLEDIRIERIRMARSPGARKYLHRLVEILSKRGLDGKPESFCLLPNDASPSMAFQAFLLYKLRHDVLGQVAIKPLLDTAEAAMDRCFSKGMRTKLEALMFEIESCTSTADVFALTEEIIRLIEEEKDEEEQKEQQQQSSDQGDDDEQSGSSSADGSSDGSGQDGADDEGDGSQGDQGQDQKAGDGQGESQSDPAQDDQANEQAGNGAGGSGALKDLLSMQDEDVMESLDDMLAKALNQAADTAARKGQVLPQANVHPMRLPNRQADTTRIKGAINAIRVKTLAWMSAASECETHLTHSGRQLDYSRLHQARFGGPIFTRTEEGVDLNANISILIDRSGSMNSRIGLAGEAALATLLAFDVQGIRTQVATFPVAGYVQGATDYDGVGVIKRWSESPRLLGGRIQSLTTDGSTPMAQAMLWAACDLLRQDEESRRIIVVVTDGQPDDMIAAREVLEIARKSGIHVLGLGIGSDTVSLFGQKSASVIHDIGQLTSAMVKLIKTALSD